MAATAAIGLIVAGGAMQASAQAQAGKANQRIADFNADQADAQARDAIARGDQAANTRRIQGRQLVGTQKVGYAAQGVQIGDGSAADTVYDTLTRTDQDVVQIKTNAALEAWGYRQSAKIGRFQGATSKAIGNMNAAGTIIGTAGAAAGVYSRMSPSSAGTTTV